MPRKDYDEIKNKFYIFENALKTKNVDCLESVFKKDVKCYLSSAKAYIDGSQHTLFGIQNFILDMPKTDFFHTTVCNYICRLHDHEAKQAAHIVCLVGRYEEEPLYFLFDMMLVNHWIYDKDTWKIDEVRMDIVKDEGNFDEFMNHWHFEDKYAKTYTGVHLPCISGELDSPWFTIKEAEDIYTDEEKIENAFIRYAFGIDHIVFSEVEKAVTEDVIALIQPWGSMNKRTWITALKFHRQKDRHWYHCGKVDFIKINGDTAHMRIYRMCGHKQREHAYQYTLENVDIEHACATYEIDLVKIGNEWKIKYLEYFLGLVELGPYQ